MKHSSGHMVRKAVIRLSLCLTCALMSVAGCNCEKTGKEVSEGTDKVVDEVIGKRAIDTGNALKGQLNDINKKHNDTLEKALEE